MYKRSETFSVIAVALGLFWLVGCSSTKQPTVETPPAATPQAAAKSPVRKAQASTSLEDLQKGQTPETPKENPLREIYFDFDDYQLKSSAREILKTNADWLMKNPSVTVTIEGHCDERGTSEYNLALGAKRAQAAKDYLATSGVSTSRLTTTSYGSEIPVCREHNEECWQRNRRDRFVATAPKPGV
jgi:peptidoglycan-associated lipoprotein